MSRQQENARLAAAKARQPVFISGLSGQHTLETGVAYWYRGHYVYACPAGTPIQPIPFVIKKGINIVGIAPDLTPRFNPQAGDLVPESSIGALKKAVKEFEREKKEEEEERKKKEVEEALEEERMGSMLRIPQQPTTSTSTATRRVPSMSTLSLFHTPHDRAHFLSDSAPGSRLHSLTNTPYASRPVSPSHAPLRQVSSTTRLHGLLGDNHGTTLCDIVERTPYRTKLRASLGGFDSWWAHEDETNCGTEDSNEYTSATASTGMYIPTAANMETTPRELNFEGTIGSPPYSRNKPIGTGRPRRASMALNQAYNAKRELHLPGLGVPTIMVQGQQQDMQEDHSRSRASKCLLHGEGCDGEYVAHATRTQHAAEGAGFKERVPVLNGEGGSRVMVDWEGLVREEREKTRRR